MLIAGGHEQSRMVWKINGRRTTWTNVGLNLPEGTKFSSNPLLLDASTYLVNASGWGKGTGGVYRTTNGGATWMQVSALEANGTPLVATDGSIYWQLMSDRGLIRSTDRGQTWTQACGSGVIKGSRVIELPDNRLAALGGKNIKVFNRSRRDVDADSGTSAHAARWRRLCASAASLLIWIGIVGTKFSRTESFATNIKSKPSCALIQFFSVPHNGR